MSKVAEQKSLVAIVGPTAVGKSWLALCLAQTFKGEIVSADSRQVYRHMDIGTAKPSRQEMALVPHHLVDIINPDEDFSLAQYQHLAFRAIEDIQQRNKLALLVGGSGLYVQAVLEGWGIPQVPPDPGFRHSLEEKAARGGTDELYQELTRVDPVAADRIDQRNVRRVIRALEVYRYAEASPSRLQHKETPPLNALIIGLTVDRTELYRRIDLRVDEMIEQGLIEEVARLVDTGYDFNLPAMSGIGYKQIGMFLRGELAIETAVQQIKFETHRFVRQQYNWFRLEDKRIHWFDIQDSKVMSEIETLVAGFIRGE
ncbi:tRNA (adenosine(37)-N6)-dimethylallyltransferase MiaA [Chloroflexota bacterium]